jgi:dipeptide/tripeptide permease
MKDNISWAIGFGIPAAAMVLAIALFVAGSKNYTHVPPTER